SYRHDAPLDLRFNQASGEKPASDLINSLNADELTHIFRTYGEERMARRIAVAIVRERDRKPVRTTTELARIVKSVVPPPHQTKSLARVFQALRIFANRELEQLEATLPKTVSGLRAGGRLAVISYHSLEDRLVKRFFQQEVRGCICPPRAPQCVCGARPRLRIVTRRAVTPTEQEKQRNPRARSAKLRVAQKVAA
ncbi:MAG: 16S rRNA (cytosine(1402)-N(4))-methyltransferase RsmH, partial [Candidatus Zixiibacteriota bacterium]